MAFLVCKGDDIQAGVCIAGRLGNRTRRLKGENLPVTIPGEKRSFLDKIFGRKAA